MNEVQVLKRYETRFNVTLLFNFTYRKLFLGGLSWDTTEEDIRSYFSKFGTILDVSIKYDAITGNPRGFGFITFAEDAIDKVLATVPHLLNNKVIDPKRAKSRPMCKKIFVGGVDANVSEDDIKSYFSQFGAVKGIELPFDHQRCRRRQFCFIIFETEAGADAACRDPKQTIGGLWRDRSRDYEVRHKYWLFEGVLSSFPHSINNRPIAPKRANSRSMHKKIFVGGVDASTPESELKQHFSRFGRVKDIEFPFDHQRCRRRQFCFVVFHNEASANAACREPKQRVCGRSCDIQKAMKLFLGGLSWDTTEDDIRSYFNTYGTVLDVSIKYDAVTGNPRGFGFITFGEDDAIDKVLTAGQHTLKNKVIDPKRAKSRPICKKIFVGGVDANVSEDEIKKYFSKYGKVEGIELPFDRQRGRRREFCFIIFDTEESADAACKEPKQTIGGRECDIKKAQPQPVAQQQKRMQQASQGNYQNYNYDGYEGYYPYNQGYDYYGQGYYGYDYWNYGYGYGEYGQTTADQNYSQAATGDGNYSGGSAQSSQSSSHSHHHGNTAGKVASRKSTPSSSTYHPYRSSSSH
ncbi:RNA-binding protein squid-like protein [Leptotrombidium deliense]|uniref:RNA-binding protein squid-like protein n=1 Tax=Leptotrombidium deliense TaxID=299467 RepID=A0A443SV35_9ACAR|nr:RNA-binding protein squid-like protein [Leptotrombidium deliense]